MGTLIPRLFPYEKELLQEYETKINQRSTPIVAIGGFSGTGKDTVAGFVKQYFEKNHKLFLKIYGAGEFIRKIAIESGWKERNLDEFMSYIRQTQNEEFAEKIDLKIEKYALKTALLEGGIFIGRMAPFTIGTYGTTIWLEVKARIIAQRITEDQNRSEYQMPIEELIQRIKTRDRIDGERLEKIYEISFREKKNFDLTLRNEGYSLNDLENIIINFLKIKYPFS